MCAFILYPATICIRTRVHSDREIVIITGANEMCMNYDLNRSTSKVGSVVHECINRTPWTLSEFPCPYTHERDEWIIVYVYNCICGVPLSVYMCVSLCRLSMGEPLFLWSVSFCLAILSLGQYDDDFFFVARKSNAEFASTTLPNISLHEIENETHCTPSCTT